MKAKLLLVIHIRIKALRYLVWVTSGYQFSIPETKPRNESSMMGD